MGLPPQTRCIWYYDVASRPTCLTPQRPTITIRCWQPRQVRNMVEASPPSFWGVRCEKCTMMEGGAIVDSEKNERITVGGRDPSAGTHHETRSPPSLREGMPESYICHWAPING